MVLFGYYELTSNLHIPELSKFSKVSLLTDTFTVLQTQVTKNIRKESYILTTKVIFIQKGKSQKISTVSNLVTLENHLKTHSEIKAKQAY